MKHPYFATYDLENSSLDIKITSGKYVERGINTYGQEKKLK